MDKTRTIIIDGIEIQTSLTGVEIADLEQKNKELIQKIKFNEKSRRKMQQSLMKQIDTLEPQVKKQKEVIDKINLIIKGIAYGGSEDYYMENFSKINELLKEVS